MPQSEFTQMPKKPIAQIYTQDKVFLKIGVSFMFALSFAVLHGISSNAMSKHVIASIIISYMNLLLRKIIMLTPD